MKILAIHGSPRFGGNSDLFLTTFLEALPPHKAEIHRINLYQLDFSPCIECGGCDSTGECILMDDFTPLYERIINCDLLVCATPIFFYSHPSKLQAFFERFQALWVRKYRLAEPHPYGKNPRGILLAVGATKGKKLFEALVRTFRYVMDACWGSYEGGLFLRGLDKKGDILNHPEALEKVKRLALSVVEENPENWPLDRSLTP